MSRDRVALLVIIFVVLGLVTLGPGVVTRHGNEACTAVKVGCSGSDTVGSVPDPLEYHATDGRVDGNAGDLFALYCQHDNRSIAVYAIVNGNGIALTSFAVDQLLAAGKTGLTVDLGDKGTVSMMATAPDQFYMVTRGGVVAAAGLNTYAKLFNCTF